MPKEVRVWRTRDGRHFDNEAEARAYEKENFVLLLIGLTNDDVFAALSRQDRDLADAIERAGAVIKAKRLGSGELRRQRSDNGAHQAQAEAEADEGPADAVSGPPWDDDEEREAV